MDRKKRKKMLLWGLGMIVAFHGLAISFGAVAIAFPNIIKRWTIDNNPNFKHKAEKVLVQGSDYASIQALHFKRNATKEVVLVCHGRSRSKGYLAPLLNRLTEKFNVFAIDFRSHGENPFGTTSIGYYESRDVAAAVDYLLEQGYEKVSIYGVSMGGVATLKFLHETKKQSKIGRVVLDGVFSTLDDLLDRKSSDLSIPGYITWCSKRVAEMISNYSIDKVTPEVWIKSVTVPILILHGKQDPLAAPASAERLYKAATSPKKKLHLYVGGHDKPENKEMQDQALKFFEGK